MTEYEKIVLIRTILSFVEEIQKGKSTPGPLGIKTRLELYTQNSARLLSGK